MLLELFPLPRRYEKVPVALVFALLVVTVFSYMKYRSRPSMLLAVAEVLLLIALYIVRARQKTEWTLFIEDETWRLSRIDNTDGLFSYISDQNKRLLTLRNRDLTEIAKLNLASAYNTAADGQRALSLLWTVNPERIMSPVQCLSYYSQALLAYMMIDDTMMAESVYEKALVVLGSLNEYSVMSFLPYELQYRLYRREYSLVLEQLNALPSLRLDGTSRQILQAIKAKALFGMGRHGDAKRIVGRISSCESLPSTEWLIKDIK